METAKAKSEEAVIWSKQNPEPPGKTDGGEETRGDAHVYCRLHVDYMYSIDAYSRPGRGTRAQRLVLGVMGRLVDAGIAGHSGDILVGSWPCMALYGLVYLPLYHYLELDPPSYWADCLCEYRSHLYTSDANTNTLPAKRTRRDAMQCIHVHVETVHVETQIGKTPW